MHDLLTSRAFAAALGFVLLPVHCLFADAAEAADGPAAILGTDPVARWVLADDTQRLKRQGAWELGGGGSDGQARNRYCWPRHLRTDEPGAALELEFEGVGIVVVFHTPRTPAYGPRPTRAEGSHWMDGLLRARVDGRPPVEIHHNREPLEVLIADDLPDGRHRLVLEHVKNGCTLLGFRILKKPSGHLHARVTGDNPNYLFDVRVSVWRGRELVRTWLHRNWLCDRVAVTGLPPGEDYRVRIEAVGWQPWEQDGIRVRAGETVSLGTPASAPNASESIRRSPSAAAPSKLESSRKIHLRQAPATLRGAVHWPAAGYQAVRIPGETFDVQADGGTWRKVRLVRRLASNIAMPTGVPAENGADAPLVSRDAPIAGRTITVPENVPPGVYDLHFISADGDSLVSPRSLVVRDRHPADELTILTWGHTDTWGQLQAEFEQSLVRVANVIGPELVLVSNSVNAAYIAGAMAGLEAPYLINFGNHRLAGHESWYGPQVGLLDLGPEFAVFNFGFPWNEDDAAALFFRADAPRALHTSPAQERSYWECRADLERLIASRAQVPGRIINAYEGDAPVELLNRHDIRLVHAAHGAQRPKVGVIPGTSTMHVGKRTASSFRIVRLKNHRVASATDPPLEAARVPNSNIPFVPAPPLRVVGDDRPSGPEHAAFATALTATVINDLPVPIPRARVVFVVPNGKYEPSQGAVEQQAVSDDGKWMEVTLRIDVDSHSTRRIELK